MIQMGNSRALYKPSLIFALIKATLLFIHLPMLSVTVSLGQHKINFDRTVTQVGYKIDDIYNFVKGDVNTYIIIMVSSCLARPGVIVLASSCLTSHNALSCCPRA
jgi:hypothetical protein